jgi:hypothetical protein
LSRLTSGRFGPGQDYGQPQLISVRLAALNKRGATFDLKIQKK